MPEIRRASFVTSYARFTRAPGNWPEFAVVGKSNVGKSSFINCVTNNHKLARTSSTPGKTALINYFALNDEFYLVDLPGYGYASAVSKAEQRAWGGMIEKYLLESKKLLRLFFLVDCRHAPGEHDKAMIHWLRHYGIPFTVVATKADKLSKAALNRAKMDIAFALQLDFASDVIAFSALKRTGRSDVLRVMGEDLAAYTAQRRSAAKEVPSYELPARRESGSIEAKCAQGGLPESIWETYSAFANTDGGTILLGVAEDEKGRLFPVPLDDPQALADEFRRMAADPAVASADVLAADSVSVRMCEGEKIVVIEVPRAGADVYPVYVGGDPKGGAYRRDGASDRRLE